jgi:hypothetical protein
VGTAITLAVRLLVPLVILRRPLLGGVLAIFADLSDIAIFNLWGWPPWPYHQLDKALDIYYLALEVWVARRWAATERRVAFALFGYRLVGVVLFESLGWRSAMMIFPNVFEWWFLLVLLRDRFRPSYTFTPARTAGWLFVLLVPKLGQEYALHGARWLDQWVLSDVVRAVWGRLTGR